MIEQDISNVPSNKIEELTEKIDRSKFTIEVQARRVVVKNIASKGLFYFYTLGELREFIQNTALESDGARRSNGGWSQNLSEAAQDEVGWLKAVIDDLRAKGKRVVADRDFWEEKAKKFEQENEMLKRGGTVAHSTDDSKFVQAKRAFAKLYHPNNANSSGIEAIIRGEVFKEFWSELERIEKGR